MAISFAGNGDYVEDTDGESFINGLTALTVLMWVKSDVIGTDKGFLICEPPIGNDSTLTCRYDVSGFEGGGTNVIKIGVTVSTDQQYESSSLVQTTDDQHIAFTWSSGNVIELWLDGVKDTPTFQGTAQSGSVSGCTTLRVGQGAKDGVSSSWDGIVHEFRLYNKVLPEDEIKTIYTCKGSDFIDLLLADGRRIRNRNRDGCGEGFDWKWKKR